MTTATATATAATETARAPRLAVVDGLRLLAALAVALYHYTVSWRIDGHSMPAELLPRLSPVAIYGFLGVELFFLISGFVICMSSWGRGLGGYAASRAGRLYPAYWACVLITAVVVVWAPVTGGVPVSTRPGPLDVLVNLTMLQEPFGVPSVDTVYWTLWVELRFYLLFAIVVGRGLTYRRAVLFCAVWLAAAIAAPGLHSPLLDAVVMPGWAPYFVAGIAFYLVHRFGPSPLPLALAGVCWLVSLAHVMDRIADVHPGFAVQPWPAPVLVTLFYAVLLAVALRWTDRIGWAWLTVAGALTYPFYLLHQRIGYSILRRTSVSVAVPVWAQIAGTVAVLLAAAWLVHRFVERPFGPRLRRAVTRALVRRRPPRPARGPEHVS